MRGTGEEEARREMVAIARLYYEHGLTHQQIAAEKGLSRIKVTRLLAQARAAGVVEVTISGAEEPFSDLAEQVAERYALDRAWISPVDTPDERRTAIAGANCLEHHLSASRVVAVGLSSTLAAAGEALGTRGTVREEGGPGFAPMAGGWGGWQEGLNPVELAAKLASHFGGRSYAFPAPLLAPSEEFAAVLQHLPEVEGALGLAASADTLLFSVGGLDWGMSALQGSIGAGERDELVRQGAVGDISGRFFNRSGGPVESSVDRRAIGMTLGQMRAVPTRILLGHGQRKFEALQAALTSRMATVLCTDSVTARALLGSSE